MVQFIINPFTSRLDAIGMGNQPGGFFATINNIPPDAMDNFTIAAGPGITITPGTNEITISSSTGAGTWTSISSSQTLAVDQGYVCVSPGGALALLLPAVSVQGDIIEVTLDGATSFSITQRAGQSIRIGNAATTAGVGGSLTSTQQGDSIRMVCQTANLKWNVLSSMGNLTVV